MAAGPNDAHPFVLYNARFRTGAFPIYDADGDLVTGATALDSEISQDFGTFADCTNEATEVATSSGRYYLDLIATETDCKAIDINIKTTSAGAKTTALSYPVLRLPIMFTGTATAGAASTITLPTTVTPPSGSAIVTPAKDNALVGCYINITNDSPSGVRGQARRIIGYVGSTRVVTIEGTWGTNPSSASTFEVLNTPEAGISPVKLVSDWGPQIRGVITGTADSGKTSALVDAERTETVVDWCKDNLITFPTLGQSRWITAFNPGNDSISFTPPLSAAISTEVYEINLAVRRPAGPKLVCEERITLASARNLAHATAFIRGKWYVAVKNTTPRIELIRYNNPHVDLTDFDTLAFPSDGKHNHVAHMVFSDAELGGTDKLYLQVDHASEIIVVEVDPFPATMTYTDLINDTTNAPAMGGQGSIVVTTTHIYVLAYASPSRILKYSIAGTYDSHADLTALNSGHWLGTDGTWLFATGAENAVTAWIARINPTTVSTFTSQAFSSDQQLITDDNLVFGGFVWVGFETGTGDFRHGYAKVDTSDITSITRFDTAYGDLLDSQPIYAITAAMGYVFVLHGGAPAIIEIVDPTTHEIRVFTMPSGWNTLNELVTDGRRLFVTSWQSPSKIHRFMLIDGGLVHDTPINFTSLAIDGDGQTGVSGISDEEIDRIVLAILKRDFTGITGEAARSVLNAMRLLRNKTSIATNTLTVTKEDDSTSAWTAATTGTSGLTVIDPT